MSAAPKPGEHPARDRGASDKRSAERRKTDRRGRRTARSQPPPHEAHAESWFGALGEDGSGTAASRMPGDDADSRLQGGLRSGHGENADSRFLSRQAKRIVSQEGTTFNRIYRGFVGARAAVGAMLVLTQAVAGLIGSRPGVLLLGLCVGYAAQALSLWLLPRFSTANPAHAANRLKRRQWLATIGVDMVAFSALHVLDASSSLNYAALLTLPVLMAGVLTPRLPALATAAAVTLTLLASAWWSLVAGGEPMLLLTQTGLLGTGFFVIALLAGELAGRLAREELTARGSLELARQQAQLNRLVLEEMQDGVMVIDRRGRVRAANPAARLLIAQSGMCRPAPFPLQGVEPWLPLMHAVEQAFAEGQWPEAGRDVTLQFAPGFSRTVRLRMRFTRRQESTGEEFCVLFVEDLLAVQSRLRQEKLAAMGRVSAGIAHEIRNPLAAIAQANALMAEDITDPGLQRLTQMVASNVERLKRIVDDVMEVAPGTAPDAGVVDAAALVGSLCSEWAMAAGLRLGSDCPLKVELPREPVGVVFDAEHMRRVLVNLLDNAHRHGSGQPGATHVWLVPKNERDAVLSVASDGEPITSEVQRFLFEPFFSTRSRGTGLGLYICRELCERYGARIDYRLRPPDAVQRNEFFVVMRREALNPASDTRLQLVP